MRHIHTIAMLLLAIIVTVPLIGDDKPRNGNYWRTQTRVDKLNYVVGFFDGMDLGHEFSYWRMPKSKGVDPCTGKALASYEDMVSEYFGGVTNDQLTDGIDAFYEDYRNRSIEISHSVWLVLNMIKGKPAVEMEKMIESWRKSRQ